MTFRWGIFGTGAISAKFVAGLAHARDAKAVMVASRTDSGAQRFANALGIERGVAGYAAAVAAGGIDAVYIATPPALHEPHAIACLEAGIPVLIEKPFARDAAEARRIVDAARAGNTFCMEGMWTRFMPAAQKMKALVDAGALGELHQVSGSFSFSNAVDLANGNFDPARGGGALAHLGFYPLSLAQWLFGTPTAIAATGRIGETGVDEDAAVSLRFASGVTGSFQTSLRVQGTNDFRVAGTHGALTFRGPVFRPYGLSRSTYTPRSKPEVANLGRKALLRESGVAQWLAQLVGAFAPRRGGMMLPYAGNGYHYEADEVARCVKAGLTESPVLPLGDSIAVAETIDRIRTLIGSGQ